jgi:hypothetical protein
MNRRRGRRVTFRLGKAMFALVVDIAGRIGSSLAEFCQVLILAESIFEFSRFEHPQDLEQFVSSVRGNKLADELDEKNRLKGALMSLSRTQSILVSGSTRNSPHAEGSELVKVRLPPGFVRSIDLYAKLTRSSRSAVLTRFFERGLLLYMRSERALTMAMAEAINANKY